MKAVYSLLHLLHIYTIFSQDWNFIYILLLTNTTLGIIYTKKTKNLLCWKQISVMSTEKAHQTR